MGRPEKAICPVKLKYLFDEGWSMKEIYTFFGTSHFTIARRLAQLGLHLDHSQQIFKRCDALQLDRLYLDGTGLREIADLYEFLCHATFRAYLSSKGITPRGWVAQKKINRAREKKREAWLSRVTNLKEYY